MSAPLKRYDIAQARNGGVMVESPEDGDYVLHDEAATEIRRLRDALEEIALAGMSGTGMESEEGMQAWHARRAWEFIGIAARALSPVNATGDAE